MKTFVILLVGLSLSASVADAAWGRRSVRRERTRIFQRYTSRCSAGQCNVQQAPPKEPVDQKEVEALSAKTDKELTQWVDELTLRELMSMPRAKVTLLKTSHIARMKVRIASGTRRGGHVGGYLGFGAGRFEGCGMSRSNFPGTCTPRRGRLLLADERSRGSNGMMYRFRIWR